MLRARHGILLATIALLGLGVVMVQSAGMEIGRHTVASPLDVLTGSSARRAALAIALLLLAWSLPVERLGAKSPWRSPIPWMTVVAIAVLAAVYVPGLGRRENGALRWIDLGPIGFQPSELVKWCLPIALAWWAARRAAGMDRFFTGLLPPLLVLGVAGAMVGKEDLGTAVLIVGVGAIVLLAGGGRIGHLAALAPLAIAGVVVAVQTMTYRVRRLEAFLHPFDDPELLNYHMIQALAAISGGGVAGRGLGNGIQKFGYLPEDTTDFVFAVICEELGLFGALAVIFLHGTILVCGLSIVRRARAPFERLLTLGVITVIGAQALMNMLVVTGLAPTKGIALPLVSHGGTGWAMTALCLGLVCAIDRRLEREAPVAASRDQAARADDGAPRVAAAAPARRRPQSDLPSRPLADPA